jgi:quinol monooxygenase YgiN
MSEAADRSDGTLIIAGSLTLPANQIDELLAAAVLMMAASQAEDGCLDYAFTADPSAPGRIRVFERWASLDSLHAHFETQHMAAFQEVLSRLTILERDLARYMVGSVEPVFARSPR